MEELKRVFGSFCTTKEIESMMLEADVNGDGKITFPEFKVLMLKFRNVNSKMHGLWTFGD